MPPRRASASPARRSPAVAHAPAPSPADGTSGRIQELEDKVRSLEDTTDSLKRTVSSLEEKTMALRAYAAGSFAIIIFTTMLLDAEDQAKETFPAYRIFLFCLSLIFWSVPPVRFCEIVYGLLGFFLLLGSFLWLGSWESGLWLELRRDSFLFFAIIFFWYATTALLEGNIFWLTKVLFSMPDAFFL